MLSYNFYFTNSYNQILHLMEPQDKVMLIQYGQLQKLAEKENDQFMFCQDNDHSLQKQYEQKNPQYKLRRYWSNNWINSERIRFITFIKKNKKSFREGFQGKKANVYHALKKAVQTKSLIQVRYHFQSLYGYYNRDIDKLVVSYQELLGMKINIRMPQGKNIARQIKLEQTPQEEAQRRQQFAEQMYELQAKWNIPIQQRKRPKDFVNLDPIFDKFRQSYNKEKEQKAARKTEQANQQKIDDDEIQTHVLIEKLP